MARIAAVLIVLLAIAASALVAVPASRIGPPGPTVAASSDLPTWILGDAWTFETHVVTRDGPNTTSAWNNLTFTVTDRMEAVQDGAYLYLYNSTTAEALSAISTMRTAAILATFATMRLQIKGLLVRLLNPASRGKL